MKEGWFGYFNLREWWGTTFTESEKAYILDNYKPMGGSSRDLLFGDKTNFTTSKTAINLLNTLACYFKTKKDLSLGLRILDKAESLLELNTPILDYHFLYHSQIELFYKNRISGKVWLDNAISACQKQIEIGPEVAKYFKSSWGGPLPSHLGYKQLSIIREKQRDYISVINLCNQALHQGWKGDWENRIERNQVKLT